MGDLRGRGTTSRSRGLKRTLLIRFDLKDEAAARGFDALAEETIAAVQALEPETLIYVVHRVEDAPLSRVFY